MKLRTLLLVAGASLLSAVLAAHAQLPGVNSTLNTVFDYTYEPSTNKPTFTSVMFTTTVASSPQDVCSLQGSATKTIRVRRVLVSGLATVAVIEPVAIIRRNAAPSAGSSTAFTPVAYDTGNQAQTVATALADIYTTNPSATVGVPSVLADTLVVFTNAANLNQAMNATFTFGQLASPVILRGISQVLSVNLNGNTVGGLTFQCQFEWTEYTDQAG